MTKNGQFIEAIGWCSLIIILCCFGHALVQPALGFRCTNQYCILFLSVNQWISWEHVAILRHIVFVPVVMSTLQYQYMPFDTPLCEIQMPYSVTSEYASEFELVCFPHFSSKNQWVGKIPLL